MGHSEGERWRIAEKNMDLRSDGSGTENPASSALRMSVNISLHLKAGGRRADLVGV